MGGGGVVLVSPAEHDPLLRELGPYDSSVETYGVDFLFPTRMGLVGVQRKTPSDLVASLRDSRWQRELVQMTDGRLDYAMLLIEGSFRWDSNGSRNLRSYRLKDYKFAEYVGFCMSVQNHGILMMHTEDVRGTAQALKGIEQWFNKPGEHDSLLRKPKGKVAAELHILQHFDGISLTRAKAIYHHFGFVPLLWRVTREQMAEVPGLGRKSVENLGKLIPWIEDYDD